MHELDPGAALAVEAAAQRLEQSRAALEVSVTVARGIEVRSPIAGIVAELPKPPAPGSGPGPVARVVCIDPLRLEASVPLGDRMPAPGTRIDLEVGAMRAAGIVRGAAPLADRYGLLVLEILVANPNGRVPAGMLARGLIDVGVRRGTFVPASAVVQSPSHALVWVAASGSVAQRSVRLISRADAEVEVAGLVDGERVARDAASPGLLAE